MTNNNIKNIIWSMGGLCIPAIIAIIFIPLIINNIGVEKFGILSIAWGFIGYASICDLGIGKATTLLVSQYHIRNETLNVKKIISIAFRKSLKYGFCFFVVLSLFIFIGIDKVIASNNISHFDIILCGLLIAITLPIQSISSMYRGVCEAYEEFANVSLVRFIIGIFCFILPYCISLFTNKIYIIISTLLFSRLIGLVFFRYIMSKANKPITEVLNYEIISNDYIESKLSSFGGWYAVSSVISPILVQSDKLFISSIISVSAVTLYSVPYELAIKLTIIPGAIVSVVFPRIIKIMTVDTCKAKIEFKLFFKYTVILMIVVISVFVFFVSDFMMLWLGRDVSYDSILIAKILAIGALINTIGLMYLTLLHTESFSDVTAKIHLFELPIYLVMLYLSCHYFGVVGVAVIWVVRVFIDTILMRFFAKRLCSIYCL